MNRINVGNMHYANGKQQIAKTVSVDAGDIAVPAAELLAVLAGFAVVE